MKHTVLIISAFILASCNRAAPPGRGEVEVIFSVAGEATRVTGSAGEAVVDDWTLLLYRDGQLAETGSSDSGAAIRKTLPAGDYTAFAVVNPPIGFTPANFPTPEALNEAVSALGDNAPDRLVMVGSRTVTVPVPDGTTQRIGVDRLVCKAAIRKISIAFINPELAALPFRLKGIYLTNCYGNSRYGSDWTAEEIRSEASAWHNRMGFQAEASVERLLAETGLDIPVTTDHPLSQEHSFYFYPNPLPETQDNRTETWTRRRTRLVLEALIGNQTYYYPVTLPASQRNRTYLIEEAVIRKLGSVDPEKDEPGAIEVFFSAIPNAWAPDYIVTENS